MNRVEKCKSENDVKDILKQLDGSLGGGESRFGGQKVSDDEVKAGMLRTWKVSCGGVEHRVDAKVYGPDDGGQWEVLIYSPSVLESKVATSIQKLSQKVRQTKSINTFARKRKIELPEDDT